MILSFSLFYLLSNTHLFFSTIFSFILHDFIVDSYTYRDKETRDKETGDREKGDREKVIGDKGTVDMKTGDIGTCDKEIWEKINRNTFSFTKNDHYVKNIFNEKILTKYLSTTRISNKHDFKHQ